jgi:hypothetical protein
VPGPIAAIAEADALQFTERADTEDDNAPPLSQRQIYSLRQLLANAAIAASRVAS